jgi:hypothetical protein
VKPRQTDHPFFKPLWIRLLIIAAAAGWGIFEFIGGSAGWGVLFLGFAAYSAWGFFVTFNPDPPKPEIAEPPAREGDR